MAVAEYSYDGQFEGNILIVGQTGCGKTIFIQNKAKRDILDIKNTSFHGKGKKYIGLFFKKTVRSKYPQTVDNFNMELTFFQRKRDDNVDIVIGENNIFNRIFVMDNVLGLADESKNFANFLTVSRKFNFTCVYVFHTMYPTRSNWQVILSQTKIFNIFPGSL